MVEPVTQVRLASQLNDRLKAVSEQTVANRPPGLTKEQILGQIIEAALDQIEAKEPPLDTLAPIHALRRTLGRAALPSVQVRAEKVLRLFISHLGGPAKKQGRPSVGEDDPVMTEVLCRMADDARFYGAVESLLELSRR